MGRVAFTIRRATEADAAALAPRLRPEEIAEVEASGGYTPLQALEESLRASEEAWAAEVNGEVACVWGVARVPDTERVGAVWLLSSGLIEEHPRAFWRACRPELVRLFERWAVLVNAIDARHHKAVRMARRLGFVLGPPQPFGEKGLLFHGFSVRKEDLHYV